jgi:hypothetical protein
MNAKKPKSDKILGQPTQLSIHYYVLSLSEQKSRLYEGFRDQLIDIQNTNFPFQFSVDSGAYVKPGAKDTQFKKFLGDTDRRFAHYFRQDPLRFVAVGEKRNLAVFEALTAHQKVLIGTVEGDYGSTSPQDLGKIVWHLVKEAMAGTDQKAMHDLATAMNVKKVISGIDAVAESVEKETGSILFVEEDYHLKGSIRKKDHSQIITRHANLWTVIDDVVDLIIEKVLGMGGSVVFLKSGSLIKLERIALILRG